MKACVLVLAGVLCCLAAGAQDEKANLSGVWKRSQGGGSTVYRIDQQGEASTYYRGLGRPQGLAFDSRGNLYVVASIGGYRGVVRIAADGSAERVISGAGLVGIALPPGRRALLAATGALYSLDWEVEGAPLPI